MMRWGSVLLAALWAWPAAAGAEDSLQKQVDDLKAEIQYIKQHYEPAEPVEIIKQVTEYVSPKGELYTEPQPGNLSPKDGSKLEERVTYRKMKFSRRESVSEKINAAIAAAVDGHVIVGMILVGSYGNTVGTGDPASNRGMGTGKLDLTFSGKPMRNTLIFADVDASSGTPGLSEAWASVRGPDKVAFVQAGVIDLTSNFDANAAANDETSQFITPDFVNSPLLGNPANGPGLVARIDGTRYHAAAGAQNSLGSAVDFTDSLYAIAELGMLYNLFGDGHIRVWGRQKPRNQQQPDQALGFSWDQRVSTKLIAFARYAKNSYVEAYDAATDSRTAINAKDWAASGGVEFSNFNKKLLKERLGLAYGRSVDQAGSSREFAEIYNRIPLTPNFAFGLHYQAAFSRIPAGLGLGALPDNHTLSLRVQASY